MDGEWQTPIIRFVKNAEVPVVPLYFNEDSLVYYKALSNIHPLLKAIQLPKSVLNLKNDNPIKIKIGTPISVKDQKVFEKPHDFGRFLRAKTFALGNSLDVDSFYIKYDVMTKKKEDKIVTAVAVEEIKFEIERLSQNYLIYEMNDYKVMFAPAYMMTNVLHEIGRLREITFREVGEGTNKSIDLDQYDVYYHHLIIWDEKNSSIVGAYRIGFGRDIIAMYGIKGFYTRSLFKIDQAMVPILQQSLELGRSFIVKEYQRKPLSLFLLWKGILAVLIKNQSYRYLIGPVSISNDLSKFSKSLLIEFVKSNYYNEILAQYIKPKKKFKVKKKFLPDIEYMIEVSDDDIDRIDRWINDIEDSSKVPILLKKYLKLNAKIIGFNIDPRFNNCIDGLMILDIFDVPQDLIESMSKELGVGDSIM